MENKRNYGYIPTSPTLEKRTGGKLWYNGVVQMEGQFPLLQLKKKEMIKAGCTGKFLISY